MDNKANNMKTKYKKGDILRSRDGKNYEFLDTIDHDQLGKIAKVRVVGTNRVYGLRFSDFWLNNL